MEQNTKEVISWFGAMGDRYVGSYLTKINVNRLKDDKQYALKCLLYNWAYERRGVARGFKIAAVKAVAASWPDLTRLPEVYSDFYKDRQDRKANPAMDPRIATLDLAAVIVSIEQGNLYRAFNMLALNGVGHKIRAFILRDLVTLLHSNVLTPGDYLLCQPIDIWIRETAKGLKLPDSVVNESLLVHDSAFPNPEDRDLARRLVGASIVAKTSPLRVNQGIWYFCSNFIGDPGRLHTLLDMGVVASLEREVALMEGVLP